MAASPISSEPRMPSGSGSGICAGPQMTLMSSSPMIMPPMVMRICFKCWPYTGRTMKRSKARPTAPATAMATSMAGSTATMLRHSWSEPVQSPMAPSTLVATKAPKAMNTPWPKLSTSIRPNTSVRPEAMMKMIMPMASPATVSVSQVLGEPMKGSTSSASAGTRASGFQSKSRAMLMPALLVGSALGARLPLRLLLI
ncbi:hypothetical protein D3C71_1289780 [compost metagenome]